VLTGAALRSEERLHRLPHAHPCADQVAHDALRIQPEHNVPEPAELVLTLGIRAVPVLMGASVHHHDELDGRSQEVHDEAVTNGYLTTEGNPKLSAGELSPELLLGVGLRLAQAVSTGREQALLRARWGGEVAHEDSSSPAWGRAQPPAGAACVTRGERPRSSLNAERGAQGAPSREARPHVGRERRREPHTLHARAGRRRHLIGATGPAHRPVSRQAQPRVVAQRVRDLSPARSAARRMSTHAAGRASTGLRAPARGARASTRSPPHRTTTGEHPRRGRIYDTLSSQFISRDPVTQAPFWSQGLNGYAYVFNDPINNVDPSGFAADGAAAGGGGLIVGLLFGSFAVHGVVVSPLRLGYTAVRAASGGYDPGTYQMDARPGNGSAFQRPIGPLDSGMPNDLRGPDERLAAIPCRPGQRCPSALDALDFGPLPVGTGVGVGVKLLRPFLTWLGKRLGARVAARAAARNIDDLVRAAQKQFPAKAGKIEHHHITPKYLGGSPKGPTVPIDGAYHQQITNEFRRHVPYGSPKPSPTELERIMQEVYSKYPLPGGG
jgi:RHS repeat-associated protein